MSRTAPTMIDIRITCRSIDFAVPDEALPVLVFHNRGVDRGCRYGNVWRLAEYGEDQLYGVTHWADLPNKDDPPVNQTAARLCDRDCEFVCGACLQGLAVCKSGIGGYAFCECDRRGVAPNKDVVRCAECMRAASSVVEEYTR